MLRKAASLERVRAVPPAVWLVLFVVLLNANALGAFFVGDDFDYLVWMRLMGDAADVVKLQFWDEWEPLWYLSWYVDQQIWGLRPLGYHLTNVAWLALAVVTLWDLMRRLWPAAPLVAWSAALLFAAHPLHDEAVTYLAARGHVICLALSLFTLLLYVCFRQSVGGARWILFGGALGVGLAASLAKEIALLLAPWVAATEGWAIRPERPRRRALLCGAAAGAVFLVPGLASLVLRRFAVGLGSDKLEGLAGDWAELIDDLGDDLPDYALLGGLPVPFAFLDYERVARFTPLGWVLLAAAVAVGIAAVSVASLRRRSSPAFGIAALGLTIVFTGIAPVFWADLPLRRRYLFVPSAGLAMMAAVGLHACRRRFPRSTIVALALLVALLGAGTVYRNQLYVGAGEVTRDLVETARGAPLGEPLSRSAKRARRVALVNLPARYGGDFLSGAYVLHHTDVWSALQLADLPQRKIVYALRFTHADDLGSRLLSWDGRRLAIRFSFRTRRAFEAALHADPAEGRRGRALEATRRGVDVERRTLDYEVTISPELDSPRVRLLLYGDGRFRPLEPPPVE